MALHSANIHYSGAAAQYFGADPGLLVAIPDRGWAPYAIVPEGFYALVTTSGAEIKTSSGSPVWPPGFMLAGPFTRISHLVTKSYCVFDVPVKGCKLLDNTTVQIDCSIVFRIMGDVEKGEEPELVRTFVHEVTPAGLEQQLKDAMAEEIRVLARTLKYTQVYTARRGTPSEQAQFDGGNQNDDSDGEEKDDDKAKKGAAEPAPGQPAQAAAARPMTTDEQQLQLGLDVTNRMEQRLNKQFKPQGVEVHDIMIQNIVLPDNISEQMSNRTMVRSKQEYEVMEQRFEMQQIRLKNDVAKLKLSHKETEDMKRVEGGRDVQAARDALKERQAEREKALNDFNQGTITEEAKIFAEMQETVTKLDFEKQQVLQTLQLEANEKAAEIRNETSAKVDELKAETQSSIAKLSAEAQMAMANAENQADSFLTKAREIELREKKLEVYASLSANPDVVLSDSSQADFNMLMLADNVLAAHSGNSEGEGGHATLAAELNMLRLASSAYGLRNDIYIPSGSGDAPLPPIQSRR